MIADILIEIHDICNNHNMTPAQRVYEINRVLEKLQRGASK